MNRPKRLSLVACALASVALAVLAAASLCFGKPSASARASTAGASGPAIGIISGTSAWGFPRMGDRLRQVTVRTGAKWLREGFHWSWIEPRRGVFRFRQFDHFMLLAARRHEHVLALLYTAPRWAAPSPTAIPRDPAAYADYVAAVVHRYGPGGTLWASHPRLASYAVDTFDLWNEPYYDNGNAGHYDPARYARMVKAAVAKARAVNSATKFLLAAEMQGTKVGAHFNWWVDSLYRVAPDLNSYFDGISVHPYGHDIRHLSPAIPDRPYTGYEQMRRIEVIRQQFVRHGAADKPFWITEVGWPTCRHGSNRCVSPAGQVRSLRAMIRYATTIWSSFVRTAFVYYYDDRRGPRSYSENDYGLTYANHKAKPVLPVFRGYASQAPQAPWG